MPSSNIDCFKFCCICISLHHGCMLLGILNIFIVSLKFRNVMKVCHMLKFHCEDLDVFETIVDISDVVMFAGQLYMSINVIVGTVKQSCLSLKLSAVILFILAILTLIRGSIESMQFGKSTFLFSAVESAFFLYCLCVIIGRTREIEDVRDQVLGSVYV